MRRLVPVRCPGGRARIRRSSRAGFRTRTRKGLNVVTRNSLTRIFLYATSLLPQRLYFPSNAMIISAPTSTFTPLLSSPSPGILYKFCRRITIVCYLRRSVFSFRRILCQKTCIIFYLYNGIQERITLRLRLRFLFSRFFLIQHILSSVCSREETPPTA